MLIFAVCNVDQNRLANLLKPASLMQGQVVGAYLSVITTSTVPFADKPP